MPVKLTTLLLWAIAAAVVVFWTLRFVGSGSEQLHVVPPAQPVQANVQAMAKDTLKPDQMTWVIVGDLAKIESEVRALKLGEVKVVDADGNPVR